MHTLAYIITRLSNLNNTQEENIGRWWYSYVVLTFNWKDFHVSFKKNVVYFKQKLCVVLMKAAAIVINFPCSRSTSLSSFLLHITKVLMSAVHISSLFTKLELSWHSKKMKILLYPNSYLISVSTNLILTFINIKHFVHMFLKTYM